MLVIKPPVDRPVPKLDDGARPGASELGGPYRLEGPERRLFFMFMDLRLVLAIFYFC